jgi:hypothetical protein
MKKLLSLGFVLFALVACVNEPMVYNDVHTGVRAGASRRYPVYQNLLVSVYGQAFIAANATETQYGIYVNQIATGTGWSFFQQAYSFGVELPYKRGQSNILGCSSFCTVEEQGAVQLTADEFNQAASAGIELKLIGTGSSIVIKVPAEAFREALEIRPK